MGADEGRTPLGENLLATGQDEVYQAGYSNGYTVGLEHGVNKATIVGPDDRVIIVLPADTSAADADRLADMMRTAGPGWSDRVLVVCGAEGLAVLKGGGTDG